MLAHTSAIANSCVHTIVNVRQSRHCVRHSISPQCFQEKAFLLLLFLYPKTSVVLLHCIAKKRDALIFPKLFCHVQDHQCSFTVIRE